MWPSSKKWKQLWAHIETLNGEMGQVQKDQHVIRNDIKWLKWLICAVFLAVLLGLLKSFLGI